MFNIKLTNISKRMIPINILITLILVIVSIYLHNGGYAHPEIQNYIPHYLSDRPLLNILFDSKVTDNGMYQARELSYFFDYIDVKFIELSIYTKMQ